MRCLTALALVPFALACSDISNPVVMPSVRATVDRAEVPLGDTVRIEVTITNDGSRPIQVQMPPGFLEVRDATGAVVASGRFRGIESAVKLAPRLVAPGESLVDKVKWAGERTTAVTPLAGTYQIRAIFSLGENEPILYSTPVTVVLTPSNGL